MSENLSPPILEFCEVTWLTDSHNLMDLCDASFVLRPADLMLVQLPARSERVPICELAQGLTTPVRGSVRFEGVCWDDAHPHEQARMRGRIGRVFEWQGWVSNLNVAENVTLAQRHHTHRPEQEILEEAEDMARMLGLEGVPSLRPHLVRNSDLRLMEWVRAFLGRPALVLLEKPEVGAPSDSVERLLDLVSRARGAGSAVIWTSGGHYIWTHERLKDAAKYAIRGNRMVAAESEDG